MVLAFTARVKEMRNASASINRLFTAMSIAPDDKFSFA